MALDLLYSLYLGDFIGRDHFLLVFSTWIFMVVMAHFLLLMMISDDVSWLWVGVMVVFIGLTGAS